MEWQEFLESYGDDVGCVWAVGVGESGFEPVDEVLGEGFVA